MAAEKLSSRISECINTNSLSAWLSLTLFSLECLRVPVEEGIRSLTNLVKENILSEQIPQIHKRKSKKCSIEETVIKKMDEIDTKGAMRIISSNDNVADLTDANYIKLLAMHSSQP